MESYNICLFTSGLFLLNFPKAHCVAASVFLSKGECHCITAFIFCLSIHLSVDRRVTSSPAVNRGVFLKTLFQFPLDTHLGIELLDHVAILSLIFEKPVYCLNHFTSPLTMHKCSHFSTSLPTLSLIEPSGCKMAALI